MRTTDTIVWSSSISRLAFGRESTFGSAATPDRFLGIVNSEVQLPDLEVDYNEYPNKGSGRRLFSIEKGREEYGPVSIDFLPTTGELFYYAFGTETIDTDTPTTGKNVHTMTVDDKGDLPSGTTTSNAVELPSMTLGAILEGGSNDFRRDFTGTTVESLNVSLNESGELSCSMDFRAHDVEKETNTSPTTFSQPSSDDSANSPPVPYEFYDRAADIHLAGSLDFTSPTYTSSDLGYDTSGSEARTWANVKSFDWSLNNNLSPLYFTRSTDGRKVAKFVTSRPDFSLSMEITPDSNDVGSAEEAAYDLLSDGTEGDILIPFQRADNDELHFGFHNCHIRAAPHPLNEEGNEVTVSVEAMPEEIRVISIDSISAYNSK